MKPKSSTANGSPEAGGIVTKLLLVLVVVALLGAAAWVFFLPALVVSQIQSRTGFLVRIDRLSVNPFTAKFHLAGVVVSNPPGWPVQDFVDLRELKAEASLRSLFTNRLVADEIVVDVARCTVVKNQQGVLNAKAFADAFSKQGSTPGPAGPAQPKSAQKGFLIKHLVLKFDTLVYSDHSGPTPTVKEYNLNLNRDLRDVDSVAKLVNPITTASIGVLTDALNGALNGRTDLLKDVAGSIKGAGKKTGEKLKGLLDSLDKKRP